MKYDELVIVCFKRVLQIINTQTVIRLYKNLFC